MADEVRFEEREMDSCEQVRISGYSIFVRIRYFPQRLTAEEILRVISHGNCAPTEMIYKLDGCCGQELEGNLYRYYCTRGDERMSVIWHDEWLTLFEVSRLGPWSIILMSYGIAAFKLIWLLVKILLGM
jgi:hypothetical protein